MLTSIIESVLFVSNKPISIKELARICERKKDEIELALDSLKEKYGSEESGINLLQNGENLEMVTNPKNSQLISGLVKDEVKSELTRPQLETLTVIAYRGPISKLELEQIRGVNCSLILRNLLIKGLVMVEEDKVVDNNTYSISMEFMRHLGINSFEELPNYVELSKSEELDDVIKESKEID